MNKKPSWDVVTCYYLCICRTLEVIHHDEHPRYRDHDYQLKIAAHLGGYSYLFLRLSQIYRHCTFLLIGTTGSTATGTWEFLDCTLPPQKGICFTSNMCRYKFYRRQDRSFVISWNFQKQNDSLLPPQIYPLLHGELNRNWIFFQ